jgi:hypothetical protein
MTNRFNRTTRLKTARFNTIGSSVSGTVLSVVDAPVPEFENGRIVGPKFDLNGTVVTQPDITIETDKGETLLHAGPGVEVAIAAALVKIKADDLEPGDTLTVTYASDEEPEEGDEFVTKVYEAVVVKGKPRKG